MTAPTDAAASETVMIQQTVIRNFKVIGPSPTVLSSVRDRSVLTEQAFQKRSLVERLCFLEHVLRDTGIVG